MVFLKDVILCFIQLWSSTVSGTEPQPSETNTRKIHTHMTPCWSSFLDLVYWLFIFKLFAGFIYRHSEEWQDSRVREGKGGQGLQLAALHHHTAARSSLWADSCINVHFVPQSVRFYSSVTSFWFHSIRPSLCTLLRALLFFIPSL